MDRFEKCICALRILHFMCLFVQLSNAPNIFPIVIRLSNTPPFTWLCYAVMSSILGLISHWLPSADSSAVEVCLYCDCSLGDKHKLCREGTRIVVRKDKTNNMNVCQEKNRDWKVRVNKQICKWETDMGHGWSNEKTPPRRFLNGLV